MSISLKAHADQLVILHGIARDNTSMEIYETAGQQAGFTTHNLHYPSTEKPFYALVEHVKEKTQTALANTDEPVHVIAYSLGTLLARQWLHEAPPKHLGHVVFIAPPAQGSEAADWWRDNALFEIIFGPAGQQLGTTPGDIGPTQTRELPPPDYPLGVIAGTASIDPLASYLIEGPDDGKVSLAGTNIKGLTDHITLDASHFMLLYNEDAAHQAIHFLKHCRFDREN